MYTLLDSILLDSIMFIKYYMYVLFIVNLNVHKNVIFREKKNHFMPADLKVFCSDVILIDGISFNRVPAPWIVSVPCFQTQVVDLGMMMTMEWMYPIVTRCPLTMRTLCIEIYSLLLYNIPQAS